MAQISIILSKETEKALRIDAEYYRKEFLDAYSFMESSGFISNIPNKLVFSVKSGSTPAIRDDRLKEGIILLKTTDIRNNVMLKEDENSFFYIEPATDEQMNKSRIKPNDVLINIVGATKEVIGRSAIVFDDFPKANITQAMAFMRLETKEILPEFLFAFLQTYYGQVQVRRIARPTGQFNLNKDEVASFKIPVLNKKIQEEVAELVHKSHEKLRAAKIAYFQAEKIVNDELNLNGLSKENTLTYSKKYSEVWRNSRIDAEYCNPRYERFIKAIQNYPDGTVLLTDKNLLDKSIKLKDEQDYNYIELSDINASMGIVDSSIIEKGYDLPSRAKRIVKKGNILVSSVEGSIDSSAMILPEKDGAICSTGFFVLDVKETYFPEYLLILMRNWLIVELLRRGCSGTILASISKAELKKIPLPRVNGEKQLEVVRLVRESQIAYAESKEILDNAKQKIEQAIKDGDF